MQRAVRVLRDWLGVAGVSFLLFALPATVRAQANDGSPAGEPADARQGFELTRRLGDVVGIAQELVRVGGEHEAILFLKTIAARHADREPGRIARRVLEEWGAADNDADPKAVAERLRARVPERPERDNPFERRVRGRAEPSDTLALAAGHIRVLIQLGLYEEAVLSIFDTVTASESDQAADRLAQSLGELRLSPDLLRVEDQFDPVAMTDALREAQEAAGAARQAQAVIESDPETGRLVRALLAEVDPNPRPQASFGRPGFGGFGRGGRGRGGFGGDRGGFGFGRGRGRGGPRRDIFRFMPPGQLMPFGPPPEPRDLSLDEALEQISRRGTEIATRNPAGARVLADLLGKLDHDAADASEILAALDAPKPSTQSVSPRPAPALAADEASAFFDADKVHEYHLELSPEAFASLQEDARTYVRGTFRHGDVLYSDVGVRLKGFLGSFRSLEDNGETKPGFTIKFNEFVQGQRFHGLRRIMLNNAVQDASYMCEYIGYGIWRKAGVPAPRVTFATLTLNDEAYGLYVQVEAINKDFLERWFGNKTGNLYEGPGDVTQWERIDRDNGPDEDDRSDLKKLVEAISASDDKDPWPTLEPLLDVERFVTFLVLERLMGHWDGYVATNNYRVYHDMDIDRFVFIPHGADQLFGRGRGDMLGTPRGVLGRAVLQTDRGKEMFKRALTRVLDDVWNEDAIRADMAKLYFRLRPYALKDPHIRGGAAAFASTVARNLDFVATQRHHALAALRNIDTQGSWKTSPPRRGFGGFPR